MDSTVTWEAALADAGIGRDHVELVASDVELDDGSLSRFVLDGDRRLVEVHVGELPELLIAGLLRHELQHVVQVDACPDLYELHAVATDVSRHPEPDEMGSTVYNTIPMEVDANFAGHRFVVGRYGSAVVDTLSIEGQPTACCGRDASPSLWTRCTAG